MIRVVLFDPSAEFDNYKFNQFKTKIDNKSTFSEPYFKNLSNKTELYMPELSNTLDANVNGMLYNFITTNYKSFNVTQPFSKDYFYYMLLMKNFDFNILTNHVTSRYRLGILRSLREQFLLSGYSYNLRYPKEYNLKTCFSIRSEDFDTCNLHILTKNFQELFIRDFSVYVIDMNEYSTNVVLLITRIELLEQNKSLILQIYPIIISIPQEHIKQYLDDIYNQTYDLLKAKLTNSPFYFPKAYYTAFFNTIQSRPISQKKKQFLPIDLPDLSKTEEST